MVRVNPTTRGVTPISRMQLTNSTRVVERFEHTVIGVRTKDSTAKSGPVGVGITTQNTTTVLVTGGEADYKRTEGNPTKRLKMRELTIKGRATWAVSYRR